LGDEEEELAPAYGVQEGSTYLAIVIYAVIFTEMI
jgi:hypothetical protein